ncbi:MAG: hypothetical protein IJ829_07430, partial [Kiritimatiellae bacterium]|nr:hypothetical protein [Kiritimatiellia bacterium]
AARAPRNTPETLVSALLAFELAALERAGLAPEIAAEKGAFALRGERRMPVSPEAARCLHDPRAEKNLKILLDAARAIGVFYSFHLDSAPDRRRTVLGMISTTTQGTERQL